MNGGSINRVAIDPDAGAMYESSGDADCAAGEKCQVGFCLPGTTCRITGDCPSGQVCIDGFCRFDVECTTDGDCMPGQTCDARGKCIP